METRLLSTTINDWLESGLSPRDIRLKLAAMKIHWNYGYSRITPAGRAKHVGPRERARNLRALGLKACDVCLSGFSVMVAGSVCPGCLIERWSPQNDQPRQEPPSSEHLPARRLTLR